MDEIGFARARRLPVEGKAEDQHDEAGGRRQRNGQRGGRAPARERVACRLDHRDSAEWVSQSPHCCQSGGAVGKSDFERAGGGAERGQRLRWSEQIEDLAAELLRIVREACDNRAVSIGDEDQSLVRRASMPAPRAPAPRT